MKSSVDQIRRRFDNDVERFSNLDVGQSATVDSPLAMDLIVRAVAAVTPAGRAVLDVGCGAGNYTLKLLERLPNLDCTLVDLSRPMLDRAGQRVGAATSGSVTTVQGDIRELAFGEGAFDVVMAAAVLHHLREDSEWEAVFAKLHRALRPGGSMWVFDLVEHALPGVDVVMRERYAEYLVGFKGERYRDEVFAYIAEEDTPRPLVWQLDLLRRVGFERVDVLHKNVCFAAFGGVKGFG
ncbi:MAG: class I SAM-dependent methyltransferase [Tepidisphaeraceae bacterium]